MVGGDIEHATKDKGTYSMVQLVILRTVVGNWFRSRFTDEAGASLIEYTFLLALIVVVALVALVYFGQTNANVLNNSANSIANHP